MNCNANLNRENRLKFADEKFDCLKMPAANELQMQN